MVQQTQLSCLRFRDQFFQLGDDGDRTSIKCDRDLRHASNVSGGEVEGFKRARSFTAQMQSERVEFTKYIPRTHYRAGEQAVLSGRFAGGAGCAHRYSTCGSPPRYTQFAIASFSAAMGSLVAVTAPCQKLQASRYPIE